MGLNTYFYMKELLWTLVALMVVLDVRFKNKNKYTEKRIKMK